MRRRPKEDRYAFSVEAPPPVREQRERAPWVGGRGAHWARTWWWGRGSAEESSWCAWQQTAWVLSAACVNHLFKLKIRHLPNLGKMRNMPRVRIRVS